VWAASCLPSPSKGVSNERPTAELKFKIGLQYNIYNKIPIPKIYFEYQERHNLNLALLETYFIESVVF